MADTIETPIRLKCVHQDSNETKFLPLNSPVSYANLSTQLESAFGPMGITYDSKQGGTLVVGDQKGLMDAISIYLSGPRKSTMRLSIGPVTAAHAAVAVAPIAHDSVAAASPADPPRTENERHQMAAASAPPPADEPLGLGEEHPPIFKRDGSGKDKGSRHSPPPGSEFGPGRTLTVKNPIPVPPPGGRHRRTNSGSFVTRKEGGAFIPEDLKPTDRPRAESASAGSGIKLSSSYHGSTAKELFNGVEKGDVQSASSFTKINTLGHLDTETRMQRSDSTASADGRLDHRRAETFPRNISSASRAASAQFSPSSYPGRIKSLKAGDSGRRQIPPGLRDDAAADDLPLGALARRGSNTSQKSVQSVQSLGGMDSLNSSTSGLYVRLPKQWQKGKHLGSGAFGQVYLAYGTDTGMEFAVKQVLLKSESGEDNLKEVQALEREIKLLKNLRHDRIVTYYGTERTPEYLAIFMEYVPGRSIHTRLMEYGAFGDELVRKYTKQVLEGLVYLHENKIVHRDIKGANVLADSAGNIKLADFGASKRLQSIKSMMGGGHKSVHGTPYWMSPEAVNPGASNGPGGGVQTFKSDIWSTAAMMVEMFTTKPPFWDCEPVAALFKIGAEAELDLRELIPDGVPAEAKTFMARCFKKDPRSRPDASDLVQDPYLAGV